SQMKAMKETVQLCLTSVFRDQPPPLSLITTNPTQMLFPTRTIAAKIPDEKTKSKEGRTCSMKHKENLSRNATAESEPVPQKLQMPPCSECEVKKAPEKQLTSFEGMAAREEKIL
ncbi:Leucine zipper protein 2, partial [Sciurus carolinensis]|nr:Leucine zipper protein 2 [Sciurus carolinensis]